MNEVLRIHNIADNDGVILLSIVMFALFSFVLYRGKYNFFHKWIVFFSGRKASGGEYANDNATDIENNSIMLLLLSMSAGFLFFEHFSTSAFGSVSFGTIFTIAGIVTGWLLVKSAVYWVANWVFFDFNKNMKWSSSYFFLISMLSLTVFPISLVKLFFQLDCSTTFFLCFILLLIYKILLICKLTIVFKPKKYGFVLIFLYFCTLEIMPALFCWHFIV